MTMNSGQRRGVAAVWLIGLLLALGGVSVDLSWRHLAVFLALLALLAWGRKGWPPLRKLEPAVMLILAWGIVLAASAQAPERALWLKRWVEGVLFLGTLGVCGGLLALRWRRPVGGIVDLLVVAFCFLFPLAVLLFQFFVGRHFEVFSIRVGVGPLAYQMLAAFSVYIVLSQLVLQDVSLRRRLKPLWIGAFCLLALLGVFRVLALGKNLMVLRQLEFEPGLVWEGVWEQAGRLDARLAREALATGAAGYWLERQDVPQAFAVLDEAVRDWPRGVRPWRRLERATGSSALATFLLGAGPVQEQGARMVAIAVDTRRGRQFFADEQGRLYLRWRESLEPLGAVDLPTDGGPVRDLLWWEVEQQLLLLLGNGSVAVLDIGPAREGASQSFRLPSVRWVHRPHGISARVLAAVPGARCVVIGYGDFEIQPVLGQPPGGGLPAAPVRRPGQDLLRDLCLLASGRGGYLVDAFGGVHPFGESPIRYEDLQEHRFEEAHYWPGRDKARAIDCTADGSALSVFDAYGGVHCIDKPSPQEPVRYLGSTRDYFDRPVVVDVVPAYDSYYLLHEDGRVDRRPGLGRTVAVLRPAPAARAAGFPALLLILLLGGVLLRSPRRVPRGGEEAIAEVGF